MPGLSAAQLEQFDREGYLVVENVLDPKEDIAALFAEYSTVLDNIVDGLVADGTLSSRYEHLPFGDRLILPPKVFANGAKANGLVSKVEWHQDNGVVLPEADEATILTVWLALTDATVQNGCMQVIPRSHREGLKDHCPVDQLRIPDALLPLDRAIPVPMKAGSALLMNQQTIHSSLDNVTEDQVRISFDLRYQPVGQPTGRPSFPGFVARSRARPETVLNDPSVWAKLWLDTRETLARRDDPTYNRWSADSPVCA
jgi:phytanoyl-CoA hydroxylase